MQFDPEVAENTKTRDNLNKFKHKGETYMREKMLLLRGTENKNLQSLQ